MTDDYFVRVPDRRTFFRTACTGLVDVSPRTLCDHAFLTNVSLGDALIHTSGLRPELLNAMGQPLQFVLRRWAGIHHVHEQEQGVSELGSAVIESRIVRALWDDKTRDTYVAVRWNDRSERIQEFIDAIESDMAVAAADLGFYESLYKSQSGATQRAASASLLIDINDCVKEYLARHPLKLYNLTSRRFEELVASLLKDMGLDVELTQASRDGGVDIYAYVRTRVVNVLMVVECKRWAAERPVGLEVVQRLYGVQQAQLASKSLIVTTSYFSRPAQEQCRRYGGLMELKDFESLKQWLSAYDRRGVVGT